LDELLGRASGAGYYRKKPVQLPEAGPADEDYIPDFLEAIPVAAIEEFLAAPAEFYNWREQVPERDLPAFVCRVRDPGRTALLTGGFAEAPNVRCFTFHTMEELEEFEPDSLAGPVSRLRAVAQASLANRVRLDSLRSSLIAFSSLKDGSLQQSDRDLLWQAFRVPIFEQFRGFANELLAWECEAHDGLHLPADTAIFETAANGDLLLTCLECPDYALLRLATGLTARIDASPCGCGDPSERLIGLRKLARRKPLHVATEVAGADWNRSISAISPAERRKRAAPATPST
jgi:hypothetical protein